MTVIQCTSCGAEISPQARFCPSCGTPAGHPDQRIAARPAPGSGASARHPMSRRAKAIYGGIAAILFAVFLVLFLTHLPGGANPVIAKQPEVAMASSYTDLALKPTAIAVEERDGKLRFPLSALLEDKIVSFDYTTESRTIPLLAYISPEGKLVTAIRLCEPCNSTTFRIEGTELACGNCDTRWKLNNLEGLQGSCQKYPPAPIPSTIAGNYVVVDRKVVLDWKIRI